MGLGGGGVWKCEERLVVFKPPMGVTITREWGWGGGGVWKCEEKTGYLGEGTITSRLGMRWRWGLEV